MGANDPRGGAIFVPRGMIGRIYIKKTTTHCYIQNMKALGQVVSEKIFLCFAPSRPPGRGLYGPQGHGWQRTTIQCYTQNIKGLGLVVSEIFFVFPIVSLWELRLSVAMETRVPIPPGPKP